MPNTSQWTNDLPAEKILKDKKLKFDVQEIELTSIDFELSKLNRGRIENKIDFERLNQYGCQMLEGAVFPRIVVTSDDQRLADDKYLILSGIHRSLGAKDAEITTISAYVVHIPSKDEMLIDYLPMLFNTTHGVNVSTDERYAQARWAMAEYNLTAAQVTKDLGVKYDAFLNFLRAEKLRQKLQTLHVDSKDIPRAILLRMNKIVNENTLTDVGQTLVTFKVPTEKANILIDQVHEATTELQAREVINRWQNQLAQEHSTRSAVKTPIRDRFIRALNTPLNLLSTHKTKRSLQITTEEDENLVRQKLQDLFDRVSDILGSDFLPSTREVPTKNSRSPKRRTMA